MALEKDQKQFLGVAVVISAIVLGGFFYMQQQGGGFAPRQPSKLMVCFVTETANTNTLPAEQKAAINSTVIRKYLDSHCYPNGFRLIDYDPSNPDRDRNLPPAFKALIEKHVKKLSTTEYPVLYVSDGFKYGAEKNFPPTTQATLEYLQTWGGP